MRIIRLFVNNPVAANMLMVILLGAGLISAVAIPRELFPERKKSAITVAIVYPGASPAEVEQGVCLKIEHALKTIENVEEMSTYARDGAGVIRLDLLQGADVDKILNEVEQEVRAVELPDRAEDPVIRQAEDQVHVLQVAVYGEPGNERAIKEIAQDIREDLQRLDSVSHVSIAGMREYEIAVELDEEALRRYGLKLEDVASRIRQEAFDLPAGRIKAADGDYALRIVGQRYQPGEYESIPVISLPDGTVLHLRDIARVRETFEDVDIRTRFNQLPAVTLHIYKTDKADSIETTQAVRDYIARRERRLPTGIHLFAFADLSHVVESRLALLTRNGLWGLVLVVGVLWMFLGLRLSFWVAMGIPVAMLSTLMVLYASGMTLNMLSTFALIMTLGLIVDDAIVVGENVHTLAERGLSPRRAAIRGTGQVATPVIGAALTTCLTFFPLLMLPGVMGAFVWPIPIVAILALGFSLLECMWILPSHLAGSLAHQCRPRTPAVPLGGAGRANPSLTSTAGFRWLIDVAFLRVYDVCTRRRYVTAATSIALILLVAGAFFGRHIRTTSFPKVDSDTLLAIVEMPMGIPVDQTVDVAQRLTAAAERLNERFPTPDGSPVIIRTCSVVGEWPWTTLFGGGQEGSHIANVIAEIAPVEQRGEQYKSSEILSAWRAECGKIPEAVNVTFTMFRYNPAGTPIELRVFADDTAEAKRVAERIKQHLATFAGVNDIRDDTTEGKRELRVQLSRKAYAMGLTQDMLARQLRDAYYGNESIEVQRGRDEVTVRVTYPEAERHSLSRLAAQRIRTPDGREIPLLDAARVQLTRGYGTLRRIDGRPAVTVSADVDEYTANAEEILTEMERSGFFGKAVTDTPSAEVDLHGQRHQWLESLDSLAVWFPVALLGVYTVLAAIFRSYFQPIIVMLSIPFGLAGAVVGHVLLGFDVTLMSTFGMVAMAGVVVNDSLVLIDWINQEVRNGSSIRAAARSAAQRRFRPIILTTVTTIAGMAPLLLEQSFQAEFLKPTAISLTCGLAFATIQTLLVVPCLYLIGHDVREALRRRGARGRGGVKGRRAPRDV